MDGLHWKTLLMIWGYHYFWKHPYVFQKKHICEHFNHIKCEAPRTGIGGEDKGLDTKNDS